MFLPKKREMLSDVWLEMDEQLSNYVWGKGVEILIVGFSAAIIFGIMGLNYTALLSIIVGFSVLIPYVGAFLATIPVVVVALLQFGIGFDFYMIVGLYLLLQALDGMTCSCSILRCCEASSCGDHACSFYLRWNIWILGGIFFYTLSYIHKGSLEFLAKCIHAK